MSWLSYLTTYGPMVVTAAAAATAVLPKPKAGSVWASVFSVVNTVALNVGNAKNAK